MPKPTENQNACAQLITQLLDGSLGPAQRDELNALLRADASCRELYLGVVSVHGLLSWSNAFSAEDRDSLDEPDAFLKEIYEQARIERIKHDAELALLKDQQAQALDAQRRELAEKASGRAPGGRLVIVPRPVFYAGLAAAALALTLVLWPLLSTQPAPPLAVRQAVPEQPAPVAAEVVRTRDAVWAPGEGPGQGLRIEGTGRLLSGLAEIAMPSGALVILEGPSVFRVVDRNTLALTRGRLTADVPEQAKYFTVRTRSMEVVDLGTRFGVTAEPEGAASACVFEGKVQVYGVAVGQTQPLRVVALTAGEQLRSAADGRLAESVTEIPPDHGYPQRWGQELAAAIPPDLPPVRAQGQARVLTDPPVSLRAGRLADTEFFCVFQESAAVLSEPTVLWAGLEQDRPPTVVTIEPGRRVVSYFVHYGPNGGGEVSATLTFPGPVLGVLTGRDLLQRTNKMLGLASTRYPLYDEQIYSSIDPNTLDAFSIGGPHNERLTITLSAGEHTDQARVLVELPAEPAAR